MMNILETTALNSNRREKLQLLLDMKGVHIHWYGKKGNRLGRKVGHITITDSTMEAIVAKAETIRKILN
jgi:5-(carboxyamino)imidazole ribonucleotide synthase